MGSRAARRVIPRYRNQGERVVEAPESRSDSVWDRRETTQPQKGQKAQNKAPVLPDSAFVPLVAIQSRNRPAPRIPSPLQQRLVLLILFIRLIHVCLFIYMDAQDIQDYCHRPPCPSSGHRACRIARAGFPCSSVSSCLSCSSCAKSFIIHHSSFGRWDGPGGRPDGGQIEVAGRRPTKYDGAQAGG